MPNKTNPTSAWQRFIHFPLVRIVIGAIVLVASVAIVQTAFTLLPPQYENAADLIGVVVIVAVALAVYSAFVKILERRQVTELSATGAGQELGAGILVGTGLFAASIGVLALLGYYTVDGVNPWQVLIRAFSGAAVSGVFEELLFRGILFRILEGWLGSWAGLVLSALLFGLLHLINPGATLWAGIAIAIEAGILLAAAFVLTRRLWLAIGIHFAVNFVEGGVFGTPVSGNPATGLLQSHLSGPAFLTGGSFGLEASVLAVGFCLLVSAVMVWRAYQRGHYMRGGTVTVP